MANMDELKKAAGVRAADMIKDGMTVGLGTGSTAAHMVNRLAERIKTEGIKVLAFLLAGAPPCSAALWASP